MMRSRWLPSLHFVPQGESAEDNGQQTAHGAVKTWVTLQVQDMGNTLGVLRWFV